MIALLTLLAARAVPPIVRGVRLAGAGRTDRATWLLGLAVRGLPEERTGWGRAMLAELDEAKGSRARLRFSLGCVRAATAIRIQTAFDPRDRGGTAMRAFVLSMVAAALGLAGYGLVRYPGLRTGPAAWAALVYLLVLLLGYAACALTLSRGRTAQAVIARRHGLIGGLAIGAAWLVTVFPTGHLKAWVFIPLLVALVGPAGVAVTTGRASRNARAATAAALWSGLIGGPLVFVVWVTTTYARNGRPYDSQLIRDFHHSGARDLAAYAVGDNVGGALGLLLIIPTVALAFGSLGGLIAARRS